MKHGEYQMPMANPPGIGTSEQSQDVIKKVAAMTNPNSSTSLLAALKNNGQIGTDTMLLDQIINQGQSNHDTNQFMQDTMNAPTLGGTQNKNFISYDQLRSYEALQGGGGVHSQSGKKEDGED